MTLFWSFRLDIDQPPRDRHRHSRSRSRFARGLAAAFFLAVVACRQSAEDQAVGPVTGLETGDAAQDAQSYAEPDETKKFVAQWKAAEQSLRNRIDTLSRQIAINTQNADAYLERGRLRRRLRELVPFDARAAVDRGALEDFDAASRLRGPNGDATALVEAARTHLRDYDLQGATALLQRAETADPENPELRAEVARMRALETGAWDDAVRTIEPLVATLPGKDSVGIWQALGFCHTYADDHAKARAAVSVYRVICVILLHDDGIGE